MARRARKPLLPQLLWGPQKRTYSRSGQIAVMRVPARSMIPQQIAVDFALVAAGVILGLTLPVLISGGIA